jgi:hypothetical protein
LVNQSLWETFNALTTEMLVNKRGRWVWVFLYCYTYVVWSY